MDKVIPDAEGGGAPMLAAADIEAFGSISDWRPIFGDEDECRRLFEQWIWPTGPYCPQCGSVKVWRLRPKSKSGNKAGRRSGLFECGDCRGQFTCTTRTPLHGTKLPLGKWLEAFYLVLGSSKGMSSVVLARHIGVTQTTAWKIGHAIRELLSDRADLDPHLKGEVEVDTLFVGGAPKPQKHVSNPRGKGTSKTQVLIAVERKGEVVAEIVPGSKATDLEPVMSAHIDPSASLMTDGDTALAAIAPAFAEHHPVNHSDGTYAFDGNHVNTAEAYSLILQRAVMGVYHRLSGPHLQRYLDEMSFRWNQRRQVIRKPTAKQKRGKGPGKRTKAGKPQWVVAVRPFEVQMAELLRGAVGREVRWEKERGGLRWPAEKPGTQPTPSSAKPETNVSSDENSIPF